MIFVLYSILLKFVLFLICYGLILKSKKIAVVDIFWSLSFLPEFLVAFYFIGFTHGNVILFLMVITWSLRLSFYLGLRSKKFKEDHRYATFSKDWPKEQFKSKVFIRIILIQFAISVLMSTCFYVYLFSPSFGWSAPFWNVPMLILFLTGLSIEILADESLRRFKLNLDFKTTPITYTGDIWRFIKYPNYLGEILIWLSFGLLALPFTFGILGLVSPVVIFFFLTYVTGIPYLESHRASKKAFPNERPQYNYIPGVF
jgi:steroid 5-alpha reductase family enzyme